MSFLCAVKCVTKSMRIWTGQVWVPQKAVDTAAISVENPWDGAPVSGYRARINRASEAAKRWVVATFLTAAVFTLPAQLQSQSCLPPDEVIDGECKKITVTLSKDALRLADDYLEILRQLAELTDAYRECYRAVQIELAGDDQHGLGLISIKLKDGSYFRNIEGLETDITALRQALVSKEEDLKERDKKAFRLSRSLRQELQALEGLLQQEVVSELRQDLDIAQHVELYLREKEDQANITVLIVGNKDSIIR